MSERDSIPGPCTYLHFVECHLAAILWKTVSPVLLLVGVCGNVVSVVVWSRKRMRCTTTSVYLRFLAVVDTMVLIVAVVREFTFYVTSVDIQEISDASCRIHTWLAFSVSASSAWVLSVLAIDRLVAIRFPIWTKSKCSKTIAFIIGCSVTLSVFLINSNMLVYLNRAEIRVNSNLTNETLLWDISCQPTTSTAIIFWTTHWPVIVLFSFSISPVACLIICNIILFKELSRRNSEHSTDNNNLGLEFSHKKKYYKSLTLMLITVCVFFLLTSLPICIYLIIYPSIFNSHSPKDMSRRMLVWAIVALLLYSNNALNFVLYCCSGTLFRRELSHLLLKPRMVVSRCRKRRVAPAGSSSFMRYSHNQTLWTSRS